MSQFEGNYRTDKTQTREVTSSFSRTLDESIIKLMTEFFAIRLIFGARKLRKTICHYSFVTFKRYCKRQYPWKMFSKFH